MSTEASRSVTPSPDRTPTARISAKVERALELMVFEGISRDEAAKAVGMLPKSLYNSFLKHRVRQKYNALLGALRESARARNFHHLETIAADSGNDMARVGAIRVMEALTDKQEVTPTRQSVAGLVLILGADPHPVHVLDAKPALPIDAEMPALSTEIGRP